MLFDNSQTNDSCFCLPGAMVKDKAKGNLKEGKRTAHGYLGGHYGGGYGNGYGYGNHHGYGNGYGYGNHHGYGYGNGYGYGKGHGYGNGYGYGNAPAASPIDHYYNDDYHYNDNYPYHDDFHYTDDYYYDDKYPEGEGHRVSSESNIRIIMQSNSFMTIIPL